MLEKTTLPHPVHLGASTFWGCVFMIFGFISFLVFFYAAVLSKMLPASGNQYISAIQNDRFLLSFSRVVGLLKWFLSSIGPKYYCLLVPLTLPVVVVAVYFHWLSMKLFKHA